MAFILCSIDEKCSIISYSSPLFKLKNFSGTSCLQLAPKRAVSSSFLDLFFERRLDLAWNWLHCMFLKKKTLFELGGLNWMDQNCRESP